MKRLLPFLVFGILLISCQKKSEQPVVAQVNQRPITLQEFKLAYQFNPFLANIKQPDSAKKAILKSLVAEKLIAQMAEDEQPQIKAYLDAYRREAIIEAFWKDVIEPKATISQQELKQAYLRSKVKKVVQYLIFTDEQEAKAAERLLNKGLSFEELARVRGFDAQSILTDTLTFSGALPNIEEQIFKMTVGQVSPPIREGFYYFVLKVVGEQHDIFTSENDFNARTESLRKKLKRQKMQKLMHQYLVKNIQGKPYHLSKETIKQLTQFFENQLIDENKPPTLNTFAQDMLNEFQQNSPELLNKNVATFYNGQKWTVKQLLDRLRFAPYPLRFENKGLFRKSFLLAIKNVLDDEVILQEAKKKNLEHTPYVKTQVQMWRDYLLFKKGLAKLLQGKSLYDPQPIYQYLNEAVQNAQITVNQALLDTLQLKRTDMAVLKQHFPGRIAVPVVPLLTHYRWPTH